MVSISNENKKMLTEAVKVALLQGTAMNLGYIERSGLIALVDIDTQKHQQQRGTLAYSLIVPAPMSFLDHGFIEIFGPKYGRIYGAIIADISPKDLTFTFGTPMYVDSMSNNDEKLIPIYKRYLFTKGEQND